MYLFSYSQRISFANAIHFSICIPIRRIGISHQLSSYRSSSITLQLNETDTVIEGKEDVFSQQIYNDSVVDTNINKEKICEKSANGDSLGINDTNHLSTFPHFEGNTKFCKKMNDFLTLTTLSTENNNGNNNKVIICSLMSAMYMRDDRKTTSNEEKKATINIRYTQRNKKKKLCLDEQEIISDVLNIGVDVLLHKERDVIKCKVIVIFKRKSNKFFPCTDTNLCYQTIKEEESNTKNNEKLYKFIVQESTDDHTKSVRKSGIDIQKTYHLIGIDEFSMLDK